MPRISEASTGDKAPWILTYQVLDNNVPGDDWDLEVCKVTASGTVFVLTPVTMGPAADPAPADRGRRHLQPER